jgi:hypothetical protein
MRKLVARCDCGAVSEVPPGPIVPNVEEPHKIIGRPNGQCCICRRPLKRDKAYWYDLDRYPRPEPELDLLSVD